VQPQLIALMLGLLARVRQHTRRHRVVLPNERIAASSDLVVYPVPFGILS